MSHATIKKGRNGKPVLEFEVVMRIPVEYEVIRKALISEVYMTACQKAVFDGIVDGLSNQEIAETMHRSERTVKFHVSNLLEKFHVKGRHQLAALAFGQKEK